MTIAPLLTCSATLLPVPLKQVIRCHSVSVWRLPSPPLKLRVVASDRLTIFAPDWVSRVSGLLPAKPTRVTVFFMVLTFFKLLCSSKGPSLRLSPDEAGHGQVCTE